MDVRKKMSMNGPFAIDHCLVVKEMRSDGEDFVRNIGFGLSFNGNKGNCCRRKAPKGELILLMAWPAAAHH